MVDALLALSNPPTLFNKLAESAPVQGRKRRPDLERRHQTHLSDDKRAELLERYLAGERAFELALAYNLDRRTVAGILGRAGIRRPRSMTDAERVEAVQLYGQGWSCARIGEHIGRNHSTVWLALKAAGVSLRSTSP